jgi:phenylalanyl-tRNA synthetase beta chain
VPESPLAQASARVREALVAYGLLETRPLPFVAGRDIEFVRVSNPIAENEAHFRRDLLTTLAMRAEYNLSHMQRSVRIFEIGAVMKPGDGRLPVEEFRVAALLMGERRPAHFSEPKPPNFDEWDAKGLAERVAQSAFPGGIVDLEPATGGALWIIVVDESARGVVRRVTLDAPVWAAPAFGLEICLATMDATPVAPRGKSAWADSPPEPERVTSVTVKYRPIPTTPSVEMDLALVVPDAVPARDVENLLIDESGPLLERIVLFDEFRGGDLGAGQRSLAWRLTFRHPDRTLGAKEIDGRREKLLKKLESTLGIKQRSN